MSDNISKEFVTILISIVKGYLDGDKFAESVLHSAEFKKNIELNFEKLGTPPSNPDENTINDNINIDDIIHLIVKDSASDGKSALKDIKNWLRGANDIIFVDPYIMTFDDRGELFKNEEEYIDMICSLVPDSTKSVRFFGINNKSTVKNCIINKLKSGRQVSYTETNKIHDRYIIKDGSEGKMIGTSLGGFGRRVFTVKDLDAEEIKTLKNILHDIN